MSRSSACAPSPCRWPVHRSRRRSAERAMPGAGVEPACLAAAGFKPAVSRRSTTRAGVVRLAWTRDGEEGRAVQDVALRGLDPVEAEAVEHGGEDHETAADDRST